MYPTPQQMRALEEAALKRIIHVSGFARISGLQAAASAALTALSNCRIGVDIHLGFTMELRLQDGPKNVPSERRLDIGVLVVASPDGKLVRSASYSLIICKFANCASTPIVRKLHFDFEPIGFRGGADPKPSSHMQLCGTFSAAHLAAGYQESRLHALYPRVEKPRVPTMPTSLALMLNWLLLEFQSTTAAQAILNDPAWRTAVVEAERLVLVPYFESAATFLKQAKHMNDRFLQRCLYQMSHD